jgi:heme/copper-type cytochrome/quinol oxidase subunit 2
MVASWLLLSTLAACLILYQASVELPLQPGEAYSLTEWYWILVPMAMLVAVAFLPLIGVHALVVWMIRRTRHGGSAPLPRRAYLGELSSAEYP